MSTKDDSLLSVSETAEILRVDPTTLRRWSNEGFLNPVRTEGGQRKYKEEEVAWVQKEGPFLKPGEVAKLFRVDPKTVTIWAEDGNLPYVKTPKGHRRYPSKNLPEGPLLILEEVADIFRVSPETIVRWADNEKLESIRTPGGHRRFPEKAVNKLLTSPPH